MSENTKAKATKQSVAKIVHIEFTDKQRASLMPLVEELRKAQQEDKVTVTIGQLDACFLLSRGYTSAWFTILHEEVGKQVLDAMTPIFRGLKRKIVNELDDGPEWHADPYAELEQARTERNIMAREASAAQARAEAAEKHRDEWQKTAQAYGDYRQSCAEAGAVPFDFWDWGMKGEPTGSEAQP